MLLEDLQKMYFLYKNLLEDIKRMDPLVFADPRRRTRVWGAYQRVRRSAQFWDVTGRAAIEDWVRARTIARQSIERKPVGLNLAQAPFVRSRWQAPRFGNVNWEDLYLYPGFIMVQSPHGSFAEDEHVPADARVVGHTWLKANKDNSPTGALEPDLLRHRPPPAALHRGDHLDALDVLRHSGTPRLMPSGLSVTQDSLLSERGV